VIFDRGLDVRRVVEYLRGHGNYLDALLGVAKFDKDGNVMAVNRGAGGCPRPC